jgi:hypothetical protein
MNFWTIGVWKIENNSLETVSTKRLKLPLSFFAIRKVSDSDAHRSATTRLG